MDERDELVANMAADIRSIALLHGVPVGSPVLGSVFCHLLLDTAFKAAMGDQAAGLEMAVRMLRECAEDHNGAPN